MRRPYASSVFLAIASKLVKAQDNAVGGLFFSPDSRGSAFSLCKNNAKITAIKRVAFCFRIFLQLLFRRRIHFRRGWSSWLVPLAHEQIVNHIDRNPGLYKAMTIS